MAQTVTVTSVDDDIIDGTINSTVIASIVDAASDDDLMVLLIRLFLYQRLMWMLPFGTIVELEGSTEVDESGDTDTFTVVLDAQPTSDVVITIVSSDTGEANRNIYPYLYPSELGYTTNCDHHRSR